MLFVDILLSFGRMRESNRRIKKKTQAFIEYTEVFFSSATISNTLLLIISVPSAMLSKKPTHKTHQLRGHHHELHDGLHNNKISYNQPHQGHHKLKLTEFDFHPVVVTRRNVSTALTKMRQSHDDEDDLRVTSNFLRKKETPIHAVSQRRQQEEACRAAERPKSKQEPRRNGWDQGNAFMLKSTVIENERPQTSKGQRPKPMEKSTLSQVPKRKISEGNEINKNKSDGLDSDHQQNGSQTNRIAFKTAIDADFLSLFAS